MFTNDFSLVSFAITFLYVNPRSLPLETVDSAPLEKRGTG